MQMPVWKHLRALALCPFIVALLMVLMVVLPASREPRFGNHRLSEWIDAYDTNLRWPDEQPPRSGFKDEDIQKALDAIGEKACSFLMRWLQEKPSPRKKMLNHFLDRQRWTHFIHYRFPGPRVSLAISGFQYYGTATRKLQPELIQLTRSKDPNKRLCAYEAFYFSRPEKDVFLPVAYRGLMETSSGVQAMTAQWLVERFPEEADKVGIRQRFPQYYPNPAEKGTNAPGKGA